MISTNKELSQALEETISSNGIKKTWLAEQLGVANQNVNKMINKKNISLDDVNKILSVMGYKASVVIEKQQVGDIMSKKELFNMLQEKESIVKFNDFYARVRFLADTIIDIIPNIDSIKLSNLLQDYYYDIIGVSNNDIWKYIDQYADELVAAGHINE